VIQKPARPADLGARDTNELLMWWPEVRLSAAAPTSAGPAQQNLLTASMLFDEIPPLYRLGSALMVLAQGFESLLSRVWCS